MNQMARNNIEYFFLLEFVYFLWYWRRDYETKPPKLQLLSQIRYHLHRNDPHWMPEPDAPLDYCYVRPNHIPTINSMCQEFFWPGMFSLLKLGKWVFYRVNFNNFLNLCMSCNPNTFTYDVIVCTNIEILKYKYLFLS